MPLLDHFHPPLSQRAGWADFHSTWANEIKARLNEYVLGAECVAQVEIKLGRAIEVDIAALTPPEPDLSWAPSGTSSATALAEVEKWAPPDAELDAPAAFPDEFEVRVFSTTGGLTLIGAIELVSPANKDRPEHRRAFAAKVVSYLHRKVGVVVVDIVTERSANLHDDIVAMLDLGPPYPFEFGPATYAVAYRPVRRPDGDRIEMWRYPLTVGGPLPVMPLGLRNLGIVPVDLELTYAEACRRSRLPMVGA